VPAFPLNIRKEDKFIEAVDEFRKERTEIMAA
jgi:hypothetical protein